MTGSDEPLSPPARLLWPVMILAAIVTLSVAGMVLRRYELGPVDDAFISLRYASNWASGSGLSFNPGERVEGYTNFLLVLLQALAIRLGLSPVNAMHLIGTIALGMLAAVSAGCACTLFPSRAWLALLTGLLVGLHPSVLCWGTSGLESGLLALLLVAALWTAMLPGRLWPWITGLLMVLAAMTRPESVLVLPAAALALAGRRPGRGTVTPLLVIFLPAFGAYFTWRALFFGALLPNTFYAKLDYGSLALTWRGLLYSYDFLLANPLLAALAVAALFCSSGWQRRWVRAALLLALLQLAVTVYEGGDHFALFRFALPAIPFLTLASVVTLETLSGRVASRRWRPGLLLAAVLLLGVAAPLGAMQSKRQEPVTISQFQRYVGECKLARNWELMGHWFRVYADADARICTVAIGAIGFISGRTIIDPHGLVDPEIARLDWKLGTGYAGHEKYDVSRVLAGRPDYIIIIHYPTRQPVPRQALPQAVWGPFAKELLKAPVIEQDYDYQSIEVSDWYMNLLVRRRR